MVSGTRQPEKKLSARFVQTVTKPGKYSDGNGLQLRVRTNGGKQWVQRITIRGERREIGLGGVRWVTLAEAREVAFENKRTAINGGDPIADKRETVAVLTFAEAVEQYLENKLSEFGNKKHGKQWGSTLNTYAIPVLGKMRVGEIQMGDVLRVLKPIWESKTETASRLRGRIEAVLSWATVSGYRTGDNPARWKDNLKEILPPPSSVAKKENQPAVALDQVSAWWHGLGERSGNAARALEFACMTAARSGEVRGMIWEEVDLDKALWIVPAERMKMKREHRVPLPAQAVVLLQAMPRMSGSKYVFFAPQGGMLSDMSLSGVMRRMHKAEVKAGHKGWLDARSKRPAVPHGLRSTFRDWAAEQGVDRDMAEMALAHAVGDRTERAYFRADMVERRRAMMDDWVHFLHHGHMPENVVVFREVGK